MYKCGRCNEPIRFDIHSIDNIQCEKCGFKIFYKARPNVKKVIRAR